MLEAAHDQRHRDARGAEWPEVLPTIGQVIDQVNEYARTKGLVDLATAPAGMADLALIQLKILDEPRKVLDCMLEQIDLLAKLAEERRAP